MNTPSENLTADQLESAGISIEGDNPFDVSGQQGDPNYERMMETFTQVQIEIDEQNAQADKYLFNQQEFIDALEHVLADQRSALKKEKIDMMEWSKRFNRWFVFCDAVVNLGITCRYSRDAMQKEDYKTVFSTLALSKVFETTFLKPRKIRVEMTHKSKEVKEKYPWLAMPCLILLDDEGVEQQIALTPSPNARVWWLDVLIGFHGSYEWFQQNDEEQDDFDEAPYPGLALYKDSEEKK